MRTNRAILVAAVAFACTPRTQPPTPAKTVFYASAVCGTRDRAALEAFNEAADPQSAARAETLYREALQHDPAFCDAMDNLGLLLRRQGKVDEAVEWYRKSLAVQPRNAMARTNLGMALRLQGKLDESLQEYSIRLQQEPDDAEAHYGAALTYMARHDWRNALDHAARAEKLYWVQRPELMSDATILKAIAEWQVGDCSSATASLEPLEKERGNEGDLNYVLGICAIESHRDELGKGVPPNTPWLDLARERLRKAQAQGKKVDPQLAQALRL